MAGPRFDPNSERSDRRGIRLQSLPLEGFKGRAPRWPKPIPKDDAGVETALSVRARALWRQSWRTPQASRWIDEPWRHEVIAEYCLVMATVEDDAARSAALIGQLHRYRDQLGLTPGGMKDNGWTFDASQEPVRSVGVVRGGSRARVNRGLLVRVPSLGELSEVDPRRH